MADTLVPDYVDAKKIFAQHAVISGTLPIEKFARFSQLLANSSGVVALSLSFFTDDNHRRVIAGEISAEVQVLCQRCLEVMTISLADSFRLGVVDSEVFAERLPPDLEPWICGDSRLVLADILEEQLILCMPIVSYHQEACVQYDRILHRGIDPEVDASVDGTGKQGKANPFAILKSLKENR